DRRRPHRGAERSAPLTRQAHATFERRAGRQRLPDQAGVDLQHPYFGAPKHLEMTGSIDGASREVDESVAALAMHERPPEVTLASADVHDADLDVKDSL